MTKLVAQEEQVTINDSIQEAAPAAVEGDYPIPVVSEDCQLTGVVDPEKIGEMWGNV